MGEVNSLGKSFWDKNRPFVIAEMSGNHNHSLERAIKIVEAAAEAGVDAVKLQTYTADTMTIDIREGEFFISDPNNLWYGNSLYELYQKAYTPWEWHEPIFKRCKELGLIGFSTPFDSSAVEFLEKLSVPAYKVASFENVDIPLIKKIALTGKPMLVSTGMATVAELDECVREARDSGCADLALLKCTSVYPAAVEESNLQTINHLRQLFECPVGISDHTMGIGASIASVALGGCIIERHFTLSRDDGGVDAAFSLNPEEMKQLVIESRNAYASLGKISYGIAEHESTSGRRSLYVVKDIKAGEVLTENNLKSIRPGKGLSPKYYELVLGKQVNRDIKKGTGLSWDMIG